MQWNEQILSVTIIEFYKCVCVITNILIMKLSHHPRKIPPASSQLPSLFWLLISCCLFINGPMQHIPFCVCLSLSMNGEIRLYVYIHQKFIPFYCWIFQILFTDKHTRIWLYILLLTAFELLPVLGYSEYSCSKSPCTNVFWGMCVSFLLGKLLGVELLGYSFQPLCNFPPFLCDKAIIMNFLWSLIYIFNPH